jgi:ABC-type lipopolysaccharide export system ATPase subunit
MNLPVMNPSVMKETAAIEVSHLTKVFGGRNAVSDVSFSVAAGEVFGFLGPNGAGKPVTGLRHSRLLPRAEIAGEQVNRREADVHPLPRLKGLQVGVGHHAVNSAFRDGE